MKTKNINKYVIMAFFGVGLGIGLFLTKSYLEEHKPLTDAQKQEELLKNFKEVEAVCGKHNTRERTIKIDEDGYRKVIGFECDNFNEAAYPEDFK